jgi:hypothetical protein
MRMFLCTLFVCAVAAVTTVTTTAVARADEPALDALYDDVARDLAAGKPLVVEVEVALCDNTIITCGGRGLGDGDDLERNLYWATDGGL